MTSSGIH